MIKVCVTFNTQQLSLHVLRWWYKIGTKVSKFMAMCLWLDPDAQGKYAGPGPTWQTAYHGTSIKWNSSCPCWVTSLFVGSSSVTLIFYPVKGEMLNGLEFRKHKLPKTYIIRVAFKSQVTNLQRHTLVRIKFRLWLKYLMITIRWQSQYFIFKLEPSYQWHRNTWRAP